MNYINQDYIEKYIRELLPQPTKDIKDLQKYAQENHIPIIHPEVGQLITLLLKTKGCKNMLEVGTAIGYSAIVFTNAMGEDSKLLTIERDQEMIFQAQNNIRKNNLENHIKIIAGEAEEVLSTLKGPFDCIFLDAAKGHYMKFLSICLDLLSDNGLLISDNVLFRGMVASDALVKRRKITIVKRMRKYLEFISHHPQLDTSIIPIGDGLAVSLKRSEDQ